MSRPAQPCMCYRNINGTWNGDENKSGCFALITNKKKVYRGCLNADCFKAFIHTHNNNTMHFDKSPIYPWLHAYSQTFMQKHFTWNFWLTTIAVQVVYALNTKSTFFVIFTELLPTGKFKSSVQSQLRITAMGIDFPVTLLYNSICCLYFHQNAKFKVPAG